MSRFPCFLYVALYFLKMFSATGNEDLIQEKFEPVKLAYDVYEPVDSQGKTDVILIHGIGVNRATFTPLAKQLKKLTGRKVYTIDLRNHGDSGYSDVFNIPSLVGDVVNFLQEQNISKANFNGHSLGGRVVMNLAIAHPEIIDKLIVTDITPKAIPQKTIDAYKKFLALVSKTPEEIPSNMSNFAATISNLVSLFLQKPDGALMNLNLIKLLVNSQSIEDSNLLKKDKGKYRLNANSPAILKSLETDHEFENDIKGICVKPTLFIYGTESEFQVGKDKDFILKRFPNAEFYPMEGSHLLFLESPHEYCNVIADFLETETNEL